MDRIWRGCFQRERGWVTQKFWTTKLFPTLNLVLRNFKQNFHWMWMFFKTPTHGLVHCIFCFLSFSLSLSFSTLFISLPLEVRVVQNFPMFALRFNWLLTLSKIRWTRTRERERERMEREEKRERREREKGLNWEWEVRQDCGLHHEGNNPLIILHQLIEFGILLNSFFLSLSLWFFSLTFFSLSLQFTPLPFL